MEFQKNAPSQMIYQKPAMIKRTTFEKWKNVVESHELGKPTLFDWNGWFMKIIFSWSNSLIKLQNLWKKLFFFSQIIEQIGVHFTKIGTDNGSNLKRMFNYLSKSVKLFNVPYNQRENLAEQAIRMIKSIIKTLNNVWKSEKIQWIWSKKPSGSKTIVFHRQSKHFQMNCISILNLKQKKNWICLQNSIQKCFEKNETD